MAIEEESYRYHCLAMPLSFSTHHPLSKRLPQVLPSPSLLFSAYNRSIRSSGAEWGGGPFAPRLNRLSPSSKPKKIIRIKDPQTGHDVTEEILSAASIGQGRHIIKASAPKPPPMVKRLPLACIPRPPPLPVRPRFNYHREPNIEFRRQNSYSDYEYDSPYDMENETSNTGRSREVRIQYDRNFLLKLRNRPASRAKPADLPNLSHIQAIIKCIHSGVEYLFERGDPKRPVVKEEIKLST